MKKEINKEGIPLNPPYYGKQGKGSVNNVPWYFHDDEYHDSYYDDFRYALDNKKSYIVTRVGDGELALMLGDAKFGIGYAGITLPNKKAQNELIQSIKNTNLLGVFSGDPQYAKLLKKINYTPKRTFYAYDSIMMPMSPEFCKILLDYKVLLVGGGIHSYNAKDYSKLLKDKLEINCEYITEIQNYSHVDSCIDKIMKKDFELCIMSAGANSNIMCSKLKDLMQGKVFLDLGHIWDNVLHPNYKEYWLLDKKTVLGV